MRRILSLVVVASLMAAPAMAYGPGPDDKDKAAKAKAPGVLLSEAAVEAARAIVIEGITGKPVELEVVAPQGSDMAGGKVAAGIALMALGAGLIYKGIDLYETDEDPFGRKKNADAYLASGVGATFIFFGVLSLRGGLAGRGFND